MLSMPCMKVSSALLKPDFLARSGYGLYCLDWNIDDIEGVAGTFPALTKHQLSIMVKLRSLADVCSTWARA